MFVANMRKLSEAGDTIVEVLVAIGVISVVLGSAYVMTNRSLQGTRDSQERVNATKLVESQIEELKSVAASNPDAIFGSGTPPSYCMSGPDASNKLNVTPSTDDLCKVDTTGTHTGVEPVFNLAITRSGNTFTVKADWVSVRGDATNEVLMKYRVYQ